MYFRCLGAAAAARWRRRRRCVSEVSCTGDRVRPCRPFIPASSIMTSIEHTARRGLSNNIFRVMIRCKRTLTWECGPMDVTRDRQARFLLQQESQPVGPRYSCRY